MIARRSRVAGCTPMPGPDPDTPLDGTTHDDVDSGASTLGVAEPTPTPTPAPPAGLVGARLGRYHVTARIGAGGMGEVYAAHDPELDRRVAIKVLPPIEADRRGPLEARLRREAQALARLAHPNVVAVYDVGVAGDRLYVAMQLVDGTTLEAEVKRGLALREVVARYLAAGRGLAAAHDAGIVHRDFKPANVLVDRKGGVWVGDFGLARGTGDEPDHAPAASSGSLLDGDMTRDGQVLGTPLYMAPEQHAGEPATPRSDQYAFAVALWEAAAGRHPFLPANRDLARMRVHMADDLVAGGAALPARMARALRRALRHDPAARWPDMPALLAELAPRSRRGWLLAGAGGAAIGAAIVTTVIVTGGDDPVAACHAGTARIAAVWPGKATALRQAIEEGGGPDAADHAGRASRVLDEYAGSWREHRRAACEAGYQTGGATPVTRDLQLRCLDDHLRVTNDVIDTLVAAEPARRARTLQVLGELPELADCAIASLAAQPAAPAQSLEALSRARADLARARALGRLGNPRAGRALIEEVVGRAETLGYPPFLAEALLANAIAVGANDGARSLALAERAVELATEHHADRSAVRALAYLLGLAANRPDRARVEVLIPVLRAAARRTGDPALEAYATVVIGTGDLVLGDYAGGLDKCERGLAAQDRDRDGDSLAFQCAVNANLGLGRIDAAIAAVDRLYGHELEYFGAGNPGLAEALQLRSMVLRRIGKFDEALAAQREVLALAEGAFGVDSRDVAEALIPLAQMMHEAGRVDEGLTYIRRALAILERTDAPPTALSMGARASLAQLLRAAGTPAQVAESFAEFRAALAVGETALSADDQRLASVRASYGMALGEAGDRQTALAQLDLAAQAFARAGNPRGAVIQVMRAQLLVDDRRCAEAIGLLEPAIVALEKVDVRNMLSGKLELAGCLWSVDGPLRDRKRAHALVVEARAGALGRGAAGTAMVASCDEWLASHPAPK
jgi:tetratricopeptide (TPR) repeat protein